MDKLPLKNVTNPSKFRKFMNLHPEVKVVIVLPQNVVVGLKDAVRDTVGVVPTGVTLHDTGWLHDFRDVKWGDMVVLAKEAYSRGAALAVQKSTFTEVLYYGRLYRDMPNGKWTDAIRTKDREPWAVFWEKLDKIYRTSTPLAVQSREVKYVSPAATEHGATNLTWPEARELYPTLAAKRLQPSWLVPGAAIGGLRLDRQFTPDDYIEYTRTTGDKLTYPEKTMGKFTCMCCGATELDYSIPKVMADTKAEVIRSTNPGKMRQGHSADIPYTCRHCGGSIRQSVYAGQNLEHLKSYIRKGVGTRARAYFEWIKMLNICNNTRHPWYREECTYAPELQTFKGFIEVIGKPKFSDQELVLTEGTHYTKDKVQWVEFCEI